MSIIPLTGAVSCRAENMLTDLTANSVEGVHQMVNGVAIPDEL
jgi:hypothetical protein